MRYTKLVQTTPEDPKLESASVYYDETGKKVYYFGTQPSPTYEMVDLGLSVKWATCNLGASSPEEYGNFYQWADTEGHTEETNEFMFAWSYYKFGNANTDVSNLTKYNSTDGLTTIEPEDDAATVSLGSKYRIPTKEECDELMTLTQTIETVNGVKGIRFTANNGNSIFIPFAGYWGNRTHSAVGERFYIWSSTLKSTLKAAYDIEVNSSGVASVDAYARPHSDNIRPVCE